jgi:hypothetical protein
VSALPDKIPFDETEWVFAPQPGQSMIFFDNGRSKRVVMNFPTLSELGPQGLDFASTLQIRTALAHAEDAIAILRAALKIKEGQ